MKKILFGFLLFSNSLYSQEYKIKTIEETKIDESNICRIVEVTIFNSTFNPFCLELSLSFWKSMLSKDTIELGNISSVSNCYQYSLLVSKEDFNRGDNEVNKFPLILNSRSSFVAFVKFVYKPECPNSSISYSICAQEGIDYNEILSKFNNSKKWRDTPKLKFREYKIRLFP